MQEAIRTHNFSLIPASLAKNGDALLVHFSELRLSELYRTFVKNRTYLTPTLVLKRVRTFVDEIAKQPDPRTRYVSASDLKTSRTRREFRL